MMWSAADGPLPDGWLEIAPTSHATQPPRRRTGLILAALSIAAVLIVAGVITVVVLATRDSGTPKAPAGAKLVSMNVDIMLVDSSGVLNFDDVYCSGMGGYDDMSEGGSITVTDEHGTVVAATSLPKGLLVGGGPTRRCEFEFVVYGLPAGHAFYGLSVTHRGTRQIPAAQLSDVELTLG